MKTLAFLLLLDFSGSMDQVWQNRAKIEILKEETTSLLSTAPAEAPSSALIFGTRPERACRDLLPVRLTTAELSREVQSLRPGALGKTPLALGLRHLVRKSIEEKVSLSIVITDGADSCGQDPCKALQIGNAELAKAGRKLKMYIIGFDLKNESKQFRCFENLRLSNIEVSMAEAASSSDLQRKIREGQMDLFDEGASLSDKDTARVRGLKKNAVVAKAVGAPGDSKAARGQSAFDAKAEALLEIVGAPSTAEFSADSKSAHKKWKGSYVVTVPAGAYVLKFLDANGGELSLELGAGTQTRVPWARLMKIHEARVRLQSALTVKWTPDDETKAVHGDLAEFTSLGDLETTGGERRVPFGTWSLEVQSPPWLKGIVPNKKINLSYGVDVPLNMELVYQEQIKWVDNPRPDILQVLRVIQKGRGESRHPIQPGVRRLPVLKDDEVEWLVPVATPAPSPAS